MASVDGVASGVVIENHVPAGFEHPSGPELKYEVGDLLPQEERKLELVLSAKQMGPATNVIVARAGPFAVVNSATLGIHVVDATGPVATEDVVVRDTGDGETIAFGLAVRGSTEDIPPWTGERISVQGTRGVGVYAYGAVYGILRDITIDGTCTDCRVPNIGVGAYEDAGLELNAFVVTGHDFCGAQAAVGGRLELEGGVLATNDNGACIDREDYDTLLLSREVEYRDNRVNIGGQALVPPPPSGPPAGG